MKYVDFVYKCNNCGKESIFTEIANADGSAPAKPDTAPFCRSCVDRGIFRPDAQDVVLAKQTEREVDVAAEYSRRRGYSKPDSVQTIQRTTFDYTDGEEVDVAAMQAERERQEQETLDALPTIADRLMRNRYGGTVEQLREEAKRRSPGGEPGGMFRAEQEKLERRGS